MKNKTIIKILSLLFVVFLVMGVVACKDGKNSGDNSSSTGNSTSKESNVTLESPQNVKLDFNLTSNNTTEFILSWDEVENASSYEIKIGDKSLTTTKNFCDIASKVTIDKETEVLITARKNKSESTASTISFLPKRVSTNIRFNKIDGGYEVFNTAKNLMGELILPDTYMGTPVVKIADYGFSATDKNGKLDNNLIIYIKSIRYPKYLKSIGEGAFINTKITEITLPETITEIEPFTFEYCRSLKTVNFANVTKIGIYAFNYCGFEELFIPKTITSIEYGAFFANYNLETVVFEDDSSLQECGIGVFACCVSLTTIPEGLPIIGEGMFSTCPGFTSVTIPSSVRKIEAFAFEECENLQSIEVPSTVTELSGGAFLFSPVSETFTLAENHPVFEIKNGVLATKDGKQIVKYFKANEQQSYTLPNGVETIADYAFYEVDSLKEISLPEGLKTIGAYAFYKSGLTSVSLPDSVTSFGRQAFTAPNLTKIRLSNSLTEICVDAFSGSYLTQIDIPDSVTKIGDYAFSFCPKLESVVLPKNLVEVCANGHKLFQDLFGALPIIPTIYFRGTETEWNEMMQKGILREELFIDVGRQMPIYFYSEEEPTDTEGLYWHYDENGNPIIWEIA